MNMSVSSEIREEQKKALSTMTTKEKWAYFWDYYKIHVFVAVIVVVLIISFVRQYLEYKEPGFYAVLLNAGTTENNVGLSDIWQEDFQEFAQIDPEEYEVYIDTDMDMSDDGMNAQYAIANRQRLIAMLQTGDISAIIADTENFESYARNGYFYDMETLLTAEELEKYRPYFYYTDAAAFEDEEADTAADMTAQPDPATLTIDHRDPSSMEKPVVAGLILTRDNKIADAGYYNYLSEAALTYQGYPSEVICGIPVTNENPALVVQFIKFLELGD